MKSKLILFLVLACLSSACADELGINIELSRVEQGKTWQTLVSIRAGYLTNYNRDNVSVESASKILRDLKFDFDGKFAVIHANDTVPVEDLIPILDAMRKNGIAPWCIQIGPSPPTGMDIWNRKSNGHEP